VIETFPDGLQKVLLFDQTIPVGTNCVEGSRAPSWDSDTYPSLSYQQGQFVATADTQFRVVAPPTRDSYTPARRET
jgi:hypothetical protein